MISWHNQITGGTKTKLFNAAVRPPVGSHSLYRNSAPAKHSFGKTLAGLQAVKSGRGEWIWTINLLVPNQIPRLVEIYWIL